MRNAAVALLALLALAAPAYAQKPTDPPKTISRAAPAEPHPMLVEAERAELKRQVRLELARRYAKAKDILAWGRALFPEKFELPFCRDMHGYLVAIRGEERTNTEAPRNHAKTTIKCFLVPIFQALEEPATFRHYLNVQATEPKALSVNRAIKVELEENDLLRELYGDQVSSQKWTDGQFVLRNGVVFTAASASMSLRGINYLNQRPDYIIVDDLYDEDDLNNADSTRKKNAWFWGSLYPARAKSRRNAVHIQGTAVNAADLHEELRKRPRWKSRTFKAVLDWDKRRVLWRELNSFADLEADRFDMGSIIFAREMQNERRDDATSIVKRGWLAGWEYDPGEMVFDQDNRIVAVELGVDPSIGASAEADYTGALRVLKVKREDERDFRYYITEVYNQHLSMNKRVELVQGMGDRSNPPVTRANIEGVSGFKDFVAEVRRRTNLPVHEVTQSKDKLTNLENRSKHFENGRVFISKRIDPKLRDLLLDQITNNHPPHDDLRDALLLCLDAATKGSWRPVV